MTDNRNEIKQVIRDFYHTQFVISIDNDTLEPLFQSDGVLLAIDHQKNISNPNAFEDICKRTKDELTELQHNHQITYALMLIFLPSKHPLTMEEFCGNVQPTSKYLPEETPRWGLGTTDDDYIRIATLLFTK